MKAAANIIMSNGVECGSGLGDRPDVSQQGNGEVR